MISKAEHAEFIAGAQRRLAAGMPLESILLEMKENGFTPVDCIRAVIDLTGCPLAEATKIVAYSSAWPELRE